MGVYKRAMSLRKGKYSHVIDKLPKLVGVELERRDLVEAVKAEILAPLTDGETPSRELDLARITNTISQHIQEVMQLLKRSTVDRHWASEFARAYADARDLRDRIKEWESSANLLVEVFQMLMIDQMEQEGITSMKLSSGRPITTFEEPYAQVQDREAFRAYCEGDSDLRRKMSLPWQTTNMFVKELLLAGEPEPPGVVCFARTVVRLGSE